MSNPLITIWTYSWVDYDLLSDDLNSAYGIMPQTGWVSKESAMEAAERDSLDRHEGEDLDYKPLEWKQRHESEEIFTAEPDDSNVVYVYAVNIY